jgi:hypothetical protein
MRAMKAIGFLCALIVVVLMAENSLAALSNNGVYIDGDGKRWKGQKTYEQNGFDLVVSWAVYNIETNPWDEELTFPEGNNYIYAYQIFNRDGLDVSEFTLLNLNNSRVSQSLMFGTQGVDDDAYGDDMMPDPNPCDEEGKWVWSTAGGFVTADGKSSFLVFASPYSPIIGKFEVQAPEDEDVPVPEPTTIALFGSAAVWFASSRNKKRRLA